MPWTHKSIRIDAVRELNDGSSYGHEFAVVISLGYTPSPGNWQETPRLEWKEQIFVHDHHHRTHWEYRTDMYADNPGSQTFWDWRRRYILAHEHRPGYGVALLDCNNRPVRFNAHGSDQEKADTVRNYLGTFGGSLLIQVTDRPRVNSPSDPQFDRERLLLIECGVAGSTQRVRWLQQLRISGGPSPNPRTRQQRNAWVPASMPCPPGYTPIVVPYDVTRSRTFALGQGEYL